MSRIENLSALVLKYDRELQAENEKLISLVAMQARENAAQKELMPALKEQAFAEFSKWAENAKGELADIAAYNAKSAVDKHGLAMAEKSAVIAGELTAKIDAKLSEARAAILAGISKETDESVRKYLASVEGAAKVRNAIKENAGPLLSAFESSGTAFIDAFQGEFKPGKQAKRGQLWTYLGSTVLCTEDTTRAPIAYGTNDKMKSWVVVASAGAPGISGGSSGGGTWGSITGTLSSQTDLQAELDAKQDAGAYAGAQVVSSLSSDALSLGAKEWAFKTATWSANKTLTYTGGSNAAGDGVVIIANITTTITVTVTPTSSTVYRNGAVSSLVSAVTFAAGKHRLTFWTPDDGTTLYMEDTQFGAADLSVAATPSFYTAASANVESHLAGIDAKLGTVDNVDGMLLAAVSAGSGLKAQNFTPFLNTSTAVMGDGTVYFCAVYLPKAATITGAMAYLGTVGSYTGDNNNKVGLYSYSGGNLTLVASSANDASLWQTGSSNSYVKKAFSSTYAASAGLYYVAFLYNQSAQTTQPALGRTATPNNAAVISLDMTNSAKLMGTLASQTDLPAGPTAMSGITAGASNIFWAGIY